MLKATVLFALLMIASSALACGGGAYDAEQELATINSALVTTTLGTSEKREIQALRDKASISPAALGVRGLMLQATYREEAMARLGLQRIAAMPESRLRAVDRALGKLKPDDTRLVPMKALRAKAETQWRASDYDGAKASLEELEKELDLHFVALRC
jgi:hypothetical protein